MKLTVRVMDRIRGKIEERMKACMAVRYSYNQMTGVMRVFLYLEPGLVLSEELTDEEAEKLTVDAAALLLTFRLQAALQSRYFKAYID